MCGFIEVVCGFLLLCDTKRILLSRLLAAPEGLEQPPFYYLALALLAAGLTMCATAALGCWATYIPGYVILTIVSFIITSMVELTSSILEISCNCSLRQYKHCTV